MKGILGRKIGMTQVFTAEGQLVPVTVVETTPSVVVRVKTVETDGYEAVQIGYGSIKEKHLTNTRASGSDEALRLVPPIQMSLEKAIEFIQDDELVEVTPQSIRLRKKILDTKERERAARR